jgi:deglycase
MDSQLETRDDLEPVLGGMRVAFLVANEGVEQAELVEPWRAVSSMGAHPQLLAPKVGEVQAFRHRDRSDRFTVDLAVEAADAANFDALVLPGGVVNADTLRLDPHAVRFVRECFEADLPAAVICHGPWILTDAGVLEGRTLTSWPSLKTDLGNAGAQWVDEEVHVDGILVSSRKPADLPAFNREVIRVFASRSPARS